MYLRDASAAQPIRVFFNNHFYYTRNPIRDIINMIAIGVLITSIGAGFVGFVISGAVTWTGSFTTIVESNILFEVSKFMSLLAASTLFFNRVIVDRDIENNVNNFRKNLINEEQYPDGINDTAYPIVSGTHHDYGTRTVPPNKMIAPITLGSTTMAGVFLGTSFGGFPVGTIVGAGLGAIGGFSLLEKVFKDCYDSDED